MTDALPRTLRAPTFLLAMAVAFVIAAHAVAKPPNILLIMTDDQGWGDIRSHGNEKIDTPALDSIARDGARLDRFYVSPVCAPTRASLLTGRYHSRSGVQGVTRALENMRTEEVTMAEVFKAAGYATGCFGKWHNGAYWPYHPNAQGFDDFSGFCGGHWNNYFNTELEHNGKPLETKGFITDVLTDAAIAFIEQHRGGPFLCYVPYNAPHSPWQVPDRYFNNYKKRGLDDTTACAYAMVSNVDDNIGRLLAKLDELKLADDTIVIFLSDNGPNSDRYNGNMKGRKGSVDEGGVRVPCFVRWPGHIKPGTDISHIAAHIDLLPTLINLTGIKPIATRPLDGMNLAPLLQGVPVKQWPDRMIFSRWANKGSVRTQQWRATKAGKGWQLYDMIADPNQKQDVAREHPDVAARLAAAYEANLKEVGRDGFADRPAWIGDPHWPLTELRGHEARLSTDDGKGISYVGKSGWANDWITNWTDADASARWPIDVKRAGRYRVTAMYNCPVDAVGCQVRALFRRSSDGASGAEIARTQPVAVDTEYDPAPVPSPDRVERKEVFERPWKPLDLGELTLPAGPANIELRGDPTGSKGGRIIDVKAVRIEWLGE